MAGLMLKGFIWTESGVIWPSTSNTPRVNIIPTPGNTGPAGSTELVIYEREAEQPAITGIAGNVSPPLIVS